MESIFSMIYENLFWSSAGDGSGIGSCPKYNKKMRSILTEFIINNDIKSFIDVPCGCCKWTSRWLYELSLKNIPIQYYGVDISEIAVKTAIKNMKKVQHNTQHNILIKKGDFTNYILPPNYDVLFCRDALQHLSYVNIWKALRNFAICNVKWYIIGGYWPGLNENINDGSYFDINLTQPPFYLIPDKIMSEENNMHHPHKHFFIFSGESFRGQLKYW
jgi:hypothetical protein